MIIHIKDTTKDVLDNVKTWKYPCYWCGKPKSLGVGFYNCCSPECEKIKIISKLLLAIDEGDIYIGKKTV